MPIEVKDNSSESGSVPVRRRNTGGVQTVARSVTLPIELDQTINGRSAKTGEGRSLIISELAQEAIENRKKKGDW